MGLDYTLASIFVVQFLANAIYSVLAPFFPIIAKEKGLRGETIGLIFSGYPIAAFLSAPIYGLMIIRFGRRKMFLTGSLLISSTLFGFSALPYLDSGSFVAVGFFSRFLQGLGVSGIVSSSFAIIASNYKDNMETVLGILNSIGALGMMLGPLIGAGIYEASSFTALYIIYGSVFVVAMVFAFLVLPMDREYIKPDIEVKLSDILGQKLVILIAGIQIMSMSTMCFLEPTLSNHLQGFGISTSLCGVFFTIPTFSYVVGILLVKLTPSHVDRKLILGFGTLLTSIGMCLMGPWDVLGLPKSLGFIIVGLSILGVGLCFNILPALPEMMKCCQKALPYHNPDDVSDAVSGVISACVYFGEILGPPSAGFLDERMGFGDASGTFGILNLIYFLVFSYYTKAFTSISMLIHGVKSESLIIPEPGHEMVTTKGNFYGSDDEDL